MADHIRQIPLHNWREDRGEVWLCTFPYEPASFGSRVGVRFSRELDQLGETDIAVGSVGGNVVLFHARPQGAGPPESAFVTVAARGDVRDLEGLITRLCEVVGIAREGLIWIQPDLSPRPWALYRLDDNGNRFLMSLFRERDVAEHVANVYENRGHKQTYSVEPAL